MSKIDKKIKVYVVGSATSYASWLNCTLTNRMEEADLVLFTGGEDVNPTLYGQKEGQFTSFNAHRDILEVEEANKAIRLGKNIFGTCRGAQLGCVISGGMLVQHMNHPYQHSLTMYDGEVIQTNSLHHQLQNPFNLYRDEYVVAGYSKGLSNIYLNGDNNELILPSIGEKDKIHIKEPELVYYRKTNWLGIQGHPEMMSYSSRMCRILRGMVYLMIEGNLDIVLTLELPSERYVDVDLVLTDAETEEYENALILRKKSLPRFLVN